MTRDEHPQDEYVRHTRQPSPFAACCPFCGRPDAGLLCDDDHCREPGLWVALPDGRAGRVVPVEELEEEAA